MTIETWKSASGRDYVKENIERLPLKPKKKIIRMLDLFEKYGPKFMQQAGYMKKLTGYAIYELIIDFNKICYRIFCVIRETACWLLLFFIKKSPGTPLREIKTALARAKELDLFLARQSLIN